MTNSFAGATTPDFAGPEIVQALAKVVPRSVRPDDALTAVMCALARRLTRGEARHLIVNLPPSVRVFFSECALERDEPAAAFDLRGLLERVAAPLKISVEEAEPITRAVMAQVQRQMTPDVFDHVAGQLPADIELVWREVAAANAAPP